MIAGRLAEHDDIGQPGLADQYIIGRAVFGQEVPGHILVRHGFPEHRPLALGFFKRGLTLFRDIIGPAKGVESDIIADRDAVEESDMSIARASNIKRGLQPGFEAFFVIHG